MIGLNAELKAREDAGRPVRIGLVGAGQMGTDVVAETSVMPGVTARGIPRWGSASNSQGSAATAAGSSAGSSRPRGSTSTAIMSALIAQRAVAASVACIGWG